VSVRASWPRTGPLATARQLFELPCRFFRLFRQLTLRIAATLAELSGQRLLTLPFGFLFLAPRQLAELFHHRINLLVILLLGRVLGRFVLVRQPVEVLLEQIS